MSYPALNPGPQEQQHDHRDRIIESLELEVRSLKIELSDAREEAESARRQSERAVANLRRQLTPLFNALRAIFGELDAISPGDTEQSSSSQIPDKKRTVWESWKQKLGGKKADVIGALLEHGTMTAVQLKVTTHSAATTVRDILLELRKLGLVDKNGGKYSLKEL